MAEKNADQAEKKESSKFDFKKVHTVEKLTSVLKELDLEFLCTYARTFATMQKMKEDSTW